MSRSVSNTPAIEPIVEEFVARHRRGERPQIAEYVARFPEQAALIEELFPALEVMEQLKPASEPLPASSQADCANQVATLGRLGDYRIVREIGRGGMGIVYEAVQESLGRRVALKVLPQLPVDHSARQARFEREARAAARLHHTNIVPVFGVGSEDGLHYYAMQYIRGLGLDEVLQELRRQRGDSAAIPNRLEKSSRSETPPEPGPGTDRREISLTVTQTLLEGRFAAPVAAGARDTTEDLPARNAHSHASERPTADSVAAADTASERLARTVQLSDSLSRLKDGHDGRSNIRRANYWRSVARIGVEVGSALQYAHEQGVLHRDIKPSNLLLDTSGTMWVTDFGLAKADDQQDLTQTGDVLGTLRYMAPEMYSGQADRRSDVYSLGLTLYELLALRPAFDESDRGRLIRLVLHETPPRLRTIDPTIPLDLETIVHKAIDREPGHRYPSAQELSADLQRFLNNEPIRARRLSPVMRFQRWSRRNPVVASLTITIASLLFLAAATSLAFTTYLKWLVADRGTALNAATAAGVVAEHEKADAHRASKQANAALDQERMFREEAERQRDLANANFARPRRAVDEYVRKISENELLTLPDFLPLRADLLAEALTFYREFTQEQTDDPELQVELAKAHQRLAVIQRELGNSLEAVAANQEAIRRFESLRDRQSDDAELANALAEAYLFAGRAAEVVALGQASLPADPSPASLRRTLARAYEHMALEAHGKGELPTAWAHFQTAADIRRQLVQEHPRLADFRGELAATLHVMGRLRVAQQQTEDALPLLHESLIQGNEAIRLAPQAIRWGRGIALAHGNVAALAERAGKPAEALEHLRKMVEIRRRLVFRNPAVGVLRSELYQSWHLLAEQQRRMEQPLEARRSLRSAAQVLDQMPRGTPAELFQRAVVHAALAAPIDSAELLWAEEGQLPASLRDQMQEHGDQAVQFLQQAVDLGWDDPVALSNHFSFDPLRARPDFRQLSDAVKSLDEANRLLASKAATDEERLANQQRAADILGQLAAQDPRQLRHQRALASTMHAVGVAQLGLEQFEASSTSLLQAEQIRQRDASDHPLDISLQFDWLATRVAQGELLWRQGRFADGHKAWKQCLDESLAMAEAHRENASLQRKLADLEMSVCEYYFAWGLVAEVQSLLERNVRFQRVIGWRGGGQTRLSDGDVAHFVLLEPRPAWRETYLRALHALTEQQGEERWFDHANLLRALSLNETNALSPERSFEVLRTFLAAQTDRSSGRWSWVEFAVALADFRAGRLKEANAWLEKRPSSQDPTTAFLDAAVAWKLGDAERARERWQRGEDLLTSQSIAALEATPPSQPRGGRGPSLLAHTVRKLAAETLADGQTVSGDPWLHLLQARLYGLLGETQQAEQEFAAAAADAVGNEVEFLIALARMQHAAGMAGSQSERTWERALELAGDDPGVLIERGRWYAERGERALSEADYARAAALAPQELNRFLATGWWVAGPYPAEIGEFCPPELDADPSVPVLGMSPKTGLTDEPVPWARIQTSDYGRLDVSRYASAPGTSALYALGHVYTPRDTTATLCLAASKAVRIWVNGELLYHFEPPDRTTYTVLLPAQFPVALRQGVNTLMVKAAADANLTVRLGDHRFDRAMELGRRGQWKEAADLLEKEIPRLPVSVADSGYFYRTLALFRFADGDIPAVRQIYQERKAHLPQPPPFSWRYEMVLIGGLAPEVVDDPQELTAWVPENRSDYLRWQRAIFLWASIRAGRWQEVIERIKADEELNRLVYECQPLLAMSYQQLGKHAEAQAALAKGWSKPTNLRAEWAGRWPGNDIYYGLVLPREAARIVTGSTAEVEEPFEEFYRQRRAARARVTPELSAFDAVFEVYPNEPHAHLAYGRRLAEVGRIDEAQAALDQAVKLAPQNGDILLERARLLHARGELALAANDFAKAIATIKTNCTMGSPIDFELGQRPDVVQLLRDRGSSPSDLNFARMVYLCRQFDWEKAREYLADESLWGITRISLALWLGDQERAHEYYKAFLEADRIAYHQALAMMLAPWPKLDSRQCLAMAQLSLSESPQSRWRQWAVGATHYRRGDYVRAIQLLERAQSGAGKWQADARCWPILALAHHRTGNPAQSRRYLKKTAVWLQMMSRARDLPHVAGEPSVNLEEWFMALALYREAKQELDGPEAFLTEVAALRDIPAYRPSVLPPLAERYAAHLNRAVEAAGDDPLPWIRRARWHREQGSSEQADADYAQAAALTPHHLQKFLETGWWVVGPYSANLEEICPPELDANPARSVPVLNPETGRQSDRAKWRRAPSGKWGQVQLTAPSLPNENSSIYACADVFTATEQTRWLMVRKGKPLRIWLNGRLVEDSRAGEFSIHPHYEQYHRVPVVLRPGRNTLLVKTRGSEFTLRIGDMPRDRAVMLFEQERFTEAMAAFLEIPADDRVDWNASLPRICWALLPYGATDELWMRSSATLVDWATSASNPQEAYCAYLSALRPSVAFDQNRKKLMAIAESFLASTPDDWKYPEAYMALVAYRAREYDRAREWLAKCSWREATGPLEALLALQAGDRAVAEQKLEEALAVGAAHEKEWLNNERYHSQTTSLYWFYDWASFLVQLQEAEQAIRGHVTQSHELKRRCEAVAKRSWSSSPETSLFDQAIVFSADHSRFPQPYIARAQRLAELGRFEAAESDFQKARELAPDDPLVLRSYARFAADRGRDQESMAVFARIHGRSPDHPLGLLFAAERQGLIQRQWHYAPNGAELPRVQQCELQPADGWLKVKTTGPEPLLTGKLWAPPGPKELWICLRYRGSLDRASVHWSTANSADCTAACPLPDGEGRWQVQRVPFDSDDELHTLSYSPAKQAGVELEIAWFALAVRESDPAIPDPPPLRTP